MKRLTVDMELSHRWRPGQGQISSHIYRLPMKLAGRPADLLTLENATTPHFLEWQRTNVFVWPMTCRQALHHYG